MKSKNIFLKIALLILLADLSFQNRSLKEKIEFLKSSINKDLLVNENCNIFPNINIIDLYGNEKRIFTDNNQRKKVIFFLKIGCPDCKNIINLINKIHENDKDKDIFVIYDNHKDEIKNQPSIYKLKPEKYYLAKTEKRKINIERYPSVIITNEKGEILRKIEGRIDASSFQFKPK